MKKLLLLSFALFITSCAHHSGKECHRGKDSKQCSVKKKCDGKSCEMKKEDCKGKSCDMDKKKCDGKSCDTDKKKKTSK